MYYPFDSARGQKNFLRFPLRNATPYNADIVSIMDHDPTAGRVVAYDGETGETDPIVDEGVTGYAKPDGSSFDIPLLGGYHDPHQSPPVKTHLFYDNHRGYDYPRPEGEDILAAGSGLLFLAIEQGSSQGDGINLWRNQNIYPKIDGVTYSWSDYNTFYIVHENGFSTWYLHARANNPLAPAIVQEIIANGYAKVAKGQVIGYVGNKGTGGSHLHFGVRKHGQVVAGNSTVSSEMIDPYGIGDALNSELLWEQLPQ
jgi:murein DD-endopeptidase MepM/ murein hydrolase activator NlpD